MKENLLLKNMSWEEIYDLAEKQGITAYVYQEFIEKDMPSEVRERFKSSAKNTVLSDERLMYDTARQVRLLEENGITCVVLKGAALSACYSSPVLRRYGDIDIYVPGKEAFEKACTLYMDKGFVREKRSYSLHHVGFFGEDGIETELHSSLLEPFSDDRINAMTSSFEKQLTITEVSVRPTLTLPALSEKDNGVYLFLHLLSHFLGEGISVRLLLDISMYFNHIKAEKSLKYFKKFMLRAGLKTFAVTVMGFCQRYLGLLSEKNPMSEFDCEYDEEKGRKLYDTVLDTGDFGHHGPEKMAVPAGSLWSVFLSQVRRQNPVEYHDPLKRPFLCIKTFCGFLKNNRTLRGVSTFSVIRDALARGKSAEALKVFKDDDSIIRKAHGNSMWPFIKDGDMVRISEVCRPLKKYDVILYRRRDKTLVLHRIIDIRYGYYFTAGDSQTELEAVAGEQVKGVMKGCYHKGRYIKAGHLAGKVWAAGLPFRWCIREVKNAFKR